MRRVIVHIDRLVLKGFRHEDRQVIAAGLQQELERVLADQDTISLLQSKGDAARLQVSGVHLDHGARPQNVGENVARGIGQEIQK